MVSGQIRPDQIRSDTSDQIRSHQVRSDQIRSDQIKSDQIRSLLRNPDVSGHIDPWFIYIYINRLVAGFGFRVLSALLLTRGRPFRLLLPLPYPPASTSPEEVLPGGLLEGSCGRRERRSMLNLLNVGTFMPAWEYETLIRMWCGKKNDCTYDNR